MRMLAAATVACGLVAFPAYAQHMNAASAPCRDAVSTVDMVSCFAAANAAADKKLNLLYASIQKTLSADERRALTNAERLWVQYRDADCAAERGLYGGGTGGAPAYLACIGFHTGQRIDALHMAYDWRLQK